MVRAPLALLALFPVLACQTSPAPGPAADPGPVGPPAAAMAFAEDPDDAADPDLPDLTGQWSANLRAIYRGAIGNLSATGEEGADIGYLRIRVDVEIQDGRVFYGRFRAGGDDAPSQEVFGAIRSDGAVATYVTADGRGLMYINSPDEIEICGGRGDGDVMLSFCSPLTRVRAASD